MPIRTPDSEPEFTLDAVPPKNLASASLRRLEQEPTNRRRVAVLALLALVLGAVAVYYFWPRGEPQLQQVAVAPTPPAAPVVPAPQAQPAILHPVEKIPGVPEVDPVRPLPPLPALDQSDTASKDSIETILNGSDYAQLLAPEGLIRRIVATVDNLPRKTVAVSILPVKPVPGPFATAKTERGTTIADDNSNRYANYVKAAESINSQRLVQFYVRLYPLFQQAYVDLGYPKGYFNDRLIAVVDHLLDAPEVAPPLYVAQPKVMFDFAEPEKQGLSAGHKIMLRVGLDNELRLKAKLRQIRKALTAEAPKR